MKKLKPKEEIGIFRIKVPDSILSRMRQLAAKKLRKVNVKMENASFLLPDWGNKQITWVYQATKEKARVFINHGKDVMVATGKVLKVDPPASFYPDLIVMENGPGQFSYLVFPKQIKDVIEAIKGGGLNGRIRHNTLPRNISIRR